jgi:hypothetical protein
VLHLSHLAHRRLAEDLGAVSVTERPWSNYTREELLSHIESKHNAMLLAARGNGSLRAELAKATEQLVESQRNGASVSIALATVTAELDELGASRFDAEVKLETLRSVHQDAQAELVKLKEHARIQSAITRESADGWVNNFTIVTEAMGWSEGRRRLWKRLAKRQRATLARVEHNTEEQEMALREQTIVLCNALAEANQLYAQEKVDNEDLRIELAELKHELRKYEPSDAMMIQLLGLNECIREAAPVVEMFEQLLADRVLSEGGPILTQVRTWLALPAVKAATKT